MPTSIQICLTRAGLPLLLAAWGWLSPAQAADEPLFKRSGTDLQAELVAAAEEGKGLAVLFEMDDCAPCARLKKQVFPHPATIRQFGKQYRTIALRLDGTEGLRDAQGQPTTAAALASRYRIQGTPAIAFIDRQGTLAYRHVGRLANVEALVSLGQYVRESAYDQTPFANYRRQAARPPARPPIRSAS